MPEWRRMARVQHKQYIIQKNFMRMAPFPLTHSAWQVWFGTILRQGERGGVPFVLLYVRPTTLTSSGEMILYLSLHNLGVSVHISYCYWW